MLENQKAKASRVLFYHDNLKDVRGHFVGDRCYLPKVYMVGNEVCITFFSALRAQRNRYILDGIKLEIEVFTIQEAWAYMHSGEKMPDYVSNKVNWNYNSDGKKDDHENMLGWQFKKYKEDPRIGLFVNIG